MPMDEREHNGGWLISLQATVPITAVLFGLSEFCPDWQPRAYIQAGLALAAVMCAPTGVQGFGAPISETFIALAMTLVAWRTHSWAWLVLGGMAILGGWLPVGKARRQAAFFFIGTALATIGVACLYLQVPVIWSWPSFHAAVQKGLGILGTLVRSAPALDSNGRVVLGGKAIHFSAFNILTAIPMIAAV
ncbi:MAG TPA: hypothetical protein VE222_13085, partial [Nitrospiraceae bacterium]|nr:hypothetical protein [Nitrospiraceae bacterium]